MKTIGDIIRSGRNQKKYSIKKLEEITKIKSDFILAIEKGKWSDLPEFPVLQGFVRNIARTLGVNIDQAMATLRRDYPPTKLSINPKPDVEKGFRWSPKLTTIIIISLSIFLVFGYLILQYLSYTRPPELDVYSPEDGVIVQLGNVMVTGKTDSDATVVINNQPVLTSDNGSFEAEIEVSLNTNVIEIVARTRSGKESIIRRNIKVELTK